MAESHDVVVDVPNDGDNISNAIVETKVTKYTSIIIGAGVGVIVLLVVFIFALSIGSTGSAEKFVTFTNSVEEYLLENFTGEANSKSGKYDFLLTNNSDKTKYIGNFSYDIKSKLAILDGNMKDPGTSSGQIIVNVNKFDFEAYYDKGNLFFDSKQLYESPILFPFEDKSGAFTNTQYDLASIITGVGSALTTSLKKMDYKSTSETISYIGENRKFSKTYFVLDNPGKRTFYNTFYSELASDSSFTSEYAKMRGQKNDEVVTIFENYATTADYSYSGNTEAGTETVVSIYTSGDKIIRFEIDNREKDEILNIDFGDTKYYVTYVKNGIKVISFDVLSLEKQINANLVKNITINYEYGDNKGSIELELVYDVKSSVKRRNDIEGANIGKITPDDYALIKERLGKFIKNTNFLDKFKEQFVNKCSVATECVCKDGTCKCLYDHEIIQCSSDEILSSNESSPENVTQTN